MLGPRAGVAVLRDRAADDDASAARQIREGGLENRAPHVVEIDVDAVRTMIAERLAHIFRLIVDGCVEAQVLRDVAALIGLRRQCRSRGTLDLGDLPGDEPTAPAAAGTTTVSRPSACRYRANQVGGHAGHSEDAQMLWQRSDSGVDFSDSLTVGQCVLLHSEHSGNVISGGEVRIARSGTIPSPSARINSPIPIGGVYERASFIHPRIAGSRETYNTWTNSSPSFGSATGSSMKVQSLGA